jgi:hypothetical protein
MICIFRWKSEVRRIDLGTNWISCPNGFANLETISFQASRSGVFPIEFQIVDVLGNPLTQICQLSNPQNEAGFLAGDTIQIPPGCLTITLETSPLQASRETAEPPMLNSGRSPRL